MFGLSEAQSVRNSKKSNIYSVSYVEVLLNRTLRSFFCTNQ